MTKTKTHIAKFSAIAWMSVAAIALSAATVGAATDLSASDLSSIDTAVGNAIAAAKANLPATASRADLDAAVAAAISNETQALISQYGQTNPMLVAEAVITASEHAGANPNEIGTGMANAALAENSATGLEIADAIGSTAPRGAVAAFQRTASAAGGNGTTLADAANSYENIGAGNGGGGGNGNRGGFFGGNGNGNGQGGGGGGGCRNPSCT
ncbi:MAG TPA: hypothetical protein VMU22_09605 [Rhizomicrobium sp.]|nr:hypothetical protein [Rhizomicrobium sp.]